MTTEIAKTEGYVVDIKNIKRNIAENFEGLIPQFIVAKIPSGGGTVFEIADEAEKVIEGVIIDHYPIRLLYLTKYGGSETKAPDCHSVDGKVGIGYNDGLSCFDCEYNQWGSYKKFVDETETTNRKACQEKHRIFILKKGELLPVLISLPATSIGNLSIYMTKLASKGLNYKTVITKISLEKTKSKNNIEYSKAVFQKAGEILENEITKAMEVAVFLKPYCRQKPVDVDVETEEVPF